MANALIGYTGFVGGNLLRQAPFEGLYNSKNVESIAGQSYDLVVCAGTPAEKGRANRDPEADRTAIGKLTSALEQVNAAQLVLISTVDVYPVPVEVDERSEIDSELAQPYGRHRFGLEIFVAARFNTLVVRLPSVYGDGMKGNAIHDLLSGTWLEGLHADSVCQFYGVDRLWKDVQAALDARLRLVNLVPEPLSVAEVAKDAFGLDFENRPEGLAPKRYDVRTRFAEVFGGSGDYLESREQVLARLSDFAKRRRGPAA